MNSANPASARPVKTGKLLLCITTACLLSGLSCPDLRAQTLPLTNGLQLWLEADAGVTANSSGQVTAWADQSGQGNNATQPDVTKAPTLAAGSLNGHATLRFDNPQYLEVPNAGSITTLTNDVTILTVAKYDDMNGYRGVVEKCVSGAPAPFDWWNNASSGGGRTSFWLNNGGAGPVRFQSNRALPVGVYSVLGFRWKDGVVDQFLNDFNIGSGAASVGPTNGATPLRIGRRPDGTVQLVGNVAEILIYKPALSDADLYKVATEYLQPKYGLVFDQPPTVAITAPADGASAAAGSPIPVSVNASDADGYPASVAVYANGALLGTASAPTHASAASYSLDVNTRYPGALTLMAVATDDYGLSSTSAPVSITVTGSAPSSLPVTAGLRLWLEADMGVQTNADGTVSKWSDQSGNLNDAISPDPTTAPTLAPDTVNGKAALHFDGTDRFLQVNSDTSFTASNLTTLAVARFNGFPNSPKQVVWTKAASGVAAPVDWWIQTDGAAQVYRGDGLNYGGPVASLPDIPSGSFTALGFAVDGLTVTHYLGAGTNGSGTIATNAADLGQPLYIGRRDDGGTQLNGDLAEILLYDLALPESDLSNVVSYLAAKYSLVQPSYASAPPAVSITTPAAGSTFAAPATLTFAASASSTLGTISQVSLFANGQPFATLTNAPYQVPLDLLTPGTVTFMAVAQDDWGLQSTSSVVVTVTGSANVPPVTAGLKAWWEADKGVTTNAAGAVTAWADQSSNGNDAAPLDPSTSPILVPNAQNGKPVLRFDGSEQYLQVAGDTSFTAGDISSFAVVKFSDFATYRTVWTKTLNNLAAPVDWYFAAGSGQPNLFRGDGSTYGGPVRGSAAPAGAYGVVGFTASGPDISEYLGYHETGSGTIAVTPGDAGLPLQIGRRMDGAVQMKGDIAEVLIYDHAVSEADRIQIANYLQAKWGITAVQVANKPPTVSLTSPTNNTSIAAQGVLNLSANAADPDDAVARVDFIANGSLVSSKTAPPYQISLQVLTRGQVTLSAQAFDIWGAGATSAPVTLTVTGSGSVSSPPMPGLVLWLKADAGVTTNADGSVASWTDQSGNGNDAAQDLASGYLSPLLVTDPQTGGPALSFDDNDRYLTVASSPSLALTNDMSLFYAASFADFATERPLCAKTASTGPHPFDYYANTAGLAVMSRADSRGATAITSAQPLPEGKLVIGGVAIEASQGTHYLQGEINGTGSFDYGSTDDGTPLLIGSRNALDDFFKGDLAEILLYNRALKGDELQSLNTYLAGKYGIPTFRLFTQPPQLTLTKTGPDTLQVSWPSSLSGFVLESSPDLSTGGWTPVTPTPVNNQAVITATNAAAFFRLRSQ